jgi:hypothetical protein
MATSALLSAGCGSAKATSSSCGPLYVFIAGGHRQPPGCDEPGIPGPTRESVKVGERFRIFIVDVGTTVPTPPAHSAIRLTHQAGHRVFYKATRPGVARLWDRHTKGCPGHFLRVSSCVVYRVIVSDHA